MGRIGVKANEVTKQGLRSGEAKKSSRRGFPQIVRDTHNVSFLMVQWVTNAEDKYQVEVMESRTNIREPNSLMC